MNAAPTVQTGYLLLAPLYTEYHILPDGQACNELLGGPLAYAAAGMRPWTQEGIGLVSRVGEDFPLAWLEELGTDGMDARGLRVLPGAHPASAFYAYDDWDHRTDVEPRVRYARLGLPLPAALREYTAPLEDAHDPDCAPDLAIRPVDIPPAFSSAHSAYLGPAHAFSQILLSVTLRERGIGTLLLAPCAKLLQPDALRTLRLVVHGTDIVFLTHARAQRMFREPSADPRRLAEMLAQMGAKMVLIQRGLEGLDIYDAISGKFTSLPAYPVTPADITGMGAALCGGFLAGWRESYDPVEAGLRALVSASLTVESHGASPAIKRAPALAEARLRSLRQLVAGRAVTN